MLKNVKKIKISSKLELALDLCLFFFPLKFSLLCFLWREKKRGGGRIPLWEEREEMRKIFWKGQTLKPSNPHCLYVRACFLGLITIAQSTDTCHHQPHDKPLISLWPISQNEMKISAGISMILNYRSLIINRNWPVWQKPKSIASIGLFTTDAWTSLVRFSCEHKSIFCCDQTVAHLELKQTNLKACTVQVHEYMHII